MKAIRDYEYLNLYLGDKPRTAGEKERNKKILELAKSIKAKRELEIKNGQYGFDSGVKGRHWFSNTSRLRLKKK